METQAKEELEVLNEGGEDTAELASCCKAGATSART
jgi:putative radical SAM-modified peptide